MFIYFDAKAITSLGYYEWGEVPTYVSSGGQT